MIGIFFSPKFNNLITGALQCLKRKKAYSEQLSKLTKAQLQLESQMFTIESANTNLSVLQAMRMGASVLKSPPIDSVMDQIEEQMDMAKEINSVLGQSATNFDDDDLEAELEELEVESLASCVWSPDVPPKAATSSPSSSFSEDEELAALAESLGMSSPSSSTSSSSSTRSSSTSSTYSSASLSPPKRYW